MANKTKSVGRPGTNQDSKNLIATLYIKHGISVQDIASSVNRSTSTVYHVIKEYKESLKDPSKSSFKLLDIELTDELLEMYGKKSKDAEINPHHYSPVNSSQISDIETSEPETRLSFKPVWNNKPSEPEVGLKFELVEDDETNEPKIEGLHFKPVPDIPDKPKPITVADLKRMIPYLAETKMVSGFTLNASYNRCTLHGYLHDAYTSYLVFNDETKKYDKLEDIDENREIEKFTIEIKFRANYHIPQLDIKIDLK